MDFISSRLVKGGGTIGERRLARETGGLYFVLGVRGALDTRIDDGIEIFDRLKAPVTSNLQEDTRGDA